MDNFLSTFDPLSLTLTIAAGVFLGHWLYDEFMNLLYGGQDHDGTE